MIFNSIYRYYAHLFVNSTVSIEEDSESKQQDALKSFAYLIQASSCT